MNPYTLRKSLNLIDANTAITRKDFESLFCKTAERITFTFNGWDGKSYGGAFLMAQRRMNAEMFGADLFG